VRGGFLNSRATVANCHFRLQSRPGSRAARACTRPVPLCLSTPVVYVCDSRVSHPLTTACLRAAGTVSTVVGTGSAGTGDGPALLAALSSPTALALSADDAILYIADSGNDTVRAWTIDGGTRSALRC
jgi:hypothetical protein